MLGHHRLSASSSTTDVQLLTLELLQKLQNDVAEMRNTLSNVDLTTTNNARRLEAMDQLLQRRPDPVASTSFEFLRDVPPLTIIGAAAALSMLLHSPKTRRTLQQTIRKLPLSLLLVGQASAGGCLLAYKGLDALRPLLGAGGGSTATREKRKLLLHLLLLLSTAALPSKVCTVHNPTSYILHPTSYCRARDSAAAVAAIAAAAIAAIAAAAGLCSASEVPIAPAPQGPRARRHDCNLGTRAGGAEREERRGVSESMRGAKR